MEITPELRDILEYLGQDLSRRKIAKKLQVHEGTLSGKLRRLYATLGVNDRDEAVAWAQAHGYGQKSQEPQKPQVPLPFDKLLPRELETIKYLAQDYTDKEIGEALGIREVTVRCHLARAYKRLGERDRGRIVEAYKSQNPPSIEKDTLSPMLRKVLGALCRDLKNWQIANELFLSEETVRTHLKRLYCSLGVKGRTEAIAWGRKNGYSQTVPRTLPFDKLSEIEIEVVKLVAQGKTNKEIGTILGIGEPNAKRHLGRAARKLGENNRGKIAASYNELRPSSPKN